MAHRDIADKTKQLKNTAQQSTVPELLVPVCYVSVCCRAPSSSIKPIRTQRVYIYIYIDTCG